MPQEKGLEFVMHPTTGIINLVKLKNTRIRHKKANSFSIYASICHSPSVALIKRGTIMKMDYKIVNFSDFI